jgi:hypothetical protein
MPTPARAMSVVGHESSFGRGCSMSAVTERGHQVGTTRSIAGWLRFLILIQCFDRPA